MYLHWHYDFVVQLKLCASFIILSLRVSHHSMVHKSLFVYFQNYNQTVFSIVFFIFMVSTYFILKASFTPSAIGIDVQKL